MPAVRQGRTGMPWARYAFALGARFALTPVACGGKPYQERWTHMLRLYTVGFFNQMHG
jgi:hypothetical protein